MKKLSIIEMISISYEWGGIEQHVKELSSGLVQNGHKVIVACRDVSLHVKAYSQVCRVETMPIRNSLDIETIYKLSRLITRENVDIVHTHTSRDSWLALFATWIAGRGKVVTTRHVPLLAKQDTFHTWYYNKLAGIICVSNFVKDKFLGTSPKISEKNIEVIYPGISINTNAKIKRRIVREEIGIDDGTFLLGFVGRVTVEKGLDDLLEAVAILKQPLNRMRVIVVGDVNPNTPDYIQELKQRSKELGISKQVEFFGFCKDIASVMNDIDALVLPSIIPETFGLVLCEAGFAKKPVITTALGAQSEIVSDGITGFLVPAKAPSEIAEKIAILISNKSLSSKMGTNANVKILDCFTSEQMAIRVENFFKSIVTDER